MQRIFHIFANAALGKGLSGGDRIFIEFTKRLSKNNQVIIHVWEEGFQMCKKQGLSESQNLKFNKINVEIFCKFGFLICYLARILAASFKAFFTSLENVNSTVLYSASEFWMDSLPAFILKLRFPKVRWVAAWFQTAPNPLAGFTQGERKKVYRLSAFYHWFMQLPIKPLIENYADLVLINNDLERKQFPKLNKLKRTLVILGAVNIEEIKEFQKNLKNVAKIYDSVFQGRFHPQKGVVELISIWKLVTEKNPKARLAMIGDGPLMNEVKREINKLALNRSIRLFGYVFDGDQKYRIFSQSKLVVHPAFFDSGGMAAAEAMAFGLPCVGFDLESYKSYYPKGMIKVRVGDLNKFADTISELLENKKKRDKIGQEAKEMINKDWSWDKRVDQLLNFIQN